MKKKVLLIHPLVLPHGGGSAVAAWTLQALRHTCDLTLLTWTAPDIAALNRTFGTTLMPGDFRQVLVAGAFRQLVRCVPGRSDLLRTHCLLRESRRLDRTQRFDVILGTHDEMDFGRRGIQYIHYPHAFAIPKPAERLGIQRLPLSIVLYRALCNAILRTTVDGFRSNITLANSAFVARAIRECHGIDAQVVHPPVPGGFPDVPWEQRDNGFVSLGRITPLKRHTESIAIVDALRRLGHDVSLDLIGTREDPACEAELRALVAARSGWLRLHLNLSREDVIQIVSGRRFGLHAQPEEPFGIAVAELVSAGCVTFVARPGGPEEIIGGNQALTFSTGAEAVRKIACVLDDASLCRDLRRHLAHQRAYFGAERFMQEMQRVVDAFV